MLTVLRKRTDEPTTTTCRLATGRSAIRHLIDVAKPCKVFMPCYVPRGVIHPFEDAGTPIVFYRLRKDLTPDIDYLAAELAGNGHKKPMIVVINYFGMMTPLAEIRALTNAYSGILFEDCAHVVPHTAGERLSDVTLYSLNKFLPVVDGAILISRRADLDVSIVEFPNANMSEMDAAVDIYDQHLEVNAQIAKCRDVDALFPLLVASCNRYEEYHAIIDGDLFPYVQSARSRDVEAATDFTAMAERRYRASTMLLVRSGPKNGIPVVRECNAEFAFPIRCHGRKDKIYSALLNIGILPSTAVDHWDHIPAEGFAIEREFIVDHLLLPLADLTLADVRRIARTIKEVLE